jgi:hypothetical protein
LKRLHQRSEDPEYMDFCCFMQCLYHHVILNKEQAMHVLKGSADPPISVWNHDINNHLFAARR